MRHLYCIGILLSAAMLVGVWDSVSFSQTYPVYDFDNIARHKNVGTVGYLDSEPSLKMDILEVNGRWYLYLAHYWPPHGWTVADVTDPRNPIIVNRIPLWTTPETTDTTQIAVADGLMLTSLEQYRAGPPGPFDEGVMVFSLADPVNPQLVGQWHTGGTGVHRVTYFGGSYAHVAARMPGYNGAIYVILDVSDPTNPVEAGRWWVPGQWEAGGEMGAPPGTGLHGAMAEGNVAYLSYQGAGFYMLDISDPANPTVLGHLPFSPPFKANLGVHSAYPRPGLYDPFPFTDRKLALVNGETNGEGCDETLTMVALVDITDMTRPNLVSIFPTPAPPKGAPYANFCEKWGRSGPHNSNDLFLNPFVQHSHDLAYITWFNAGLRIFDISDPRVPKEVGYYIPPNPEEMLSPILPRTALTVQSQYGLVDTRGYIYLSHWNQGIWIVKYTGPMKDNP